MKKARLITILTIFVTLSLLLLTGCKKDDRISSVALKDHDSNTAIEIAVGEFDYSSYTLVVTYESGNTEELALTKEMIVETDIFKFYQVGEHDINISYQKHTYTFKVSVKRSTFKELSLPQDNVFTYDGKPHVVEVEGDIPANAVITYTGGNSFINAGTYDVIAIVSCDGYVTERLTTTVKIERAKYDMSNVRFEAKEFIYDGKSHSVAISGTLPEGVSMPTYTINEKETASAIDAGEYRVVARFSNNDPNYETIPDMETTLKIIPAEYTINGVEIVFQKENGELIDGATMIYNGTSVIFDLNDYSKLSKKVSVSFSVCDKDGNVISTSNKTTNIKDVGVYTVKAEFALADGKNYNPIEPIVYTFEILKSEYPSIENIWLASMQTTYDGTEHSIVVEGQLPEGVTVSYEYYRGNTLVVDANGEPVQSVIDAGIYTVKAVFMHANKNYGEIPGISATLKIKQSVASVSAIGFTGESIVEYSGLRYEPTFKTWKDTFGSDYDIFQYGEAKYYILDNNSGKYVEMGDGEYPTDVGSYRASVDIGIAEEYKNNYVFSGGATIQTIVKQFEIVKKTIESPSVEFTSDSKWEYTGNSQEINYTCNADTSLVTTSALYYRYTAGEYTAMQSGEIPTNVGSYRVIVTATLNDVTRYVFANGENSETFSFEFDIFAQTIDVSGIALSFTTVVYNGQSQNPSLVGVPTLVNTTFKLYTLNGTKEIMQAIDVGEYRLEAMLAPNSSNYTLSTNKVVFNFEILPQTIDVQGLAFDSVVFYCNGTNQQPTLMNIPENVVSVVEIFDATGIRVPDSINKGTYRCEVTLTPKNSNYVLDGDGVYSTSFEIRKSQINLNDRFKDPIELTYTEQGYNDDLLSAVVLNGISGYTDCLLNSYRVSIGEDQWQYTSTMIERGIYKVQIQFRILDSDNYVFLYDDLELLTATVDVYFKVV